MKALSLSVSRPRKANGSRLRDRADAMHHQTLFTHRKSGAFGPAAVNIGQGQGVNIVPALFAAAAMFDHIALAIARRRIAPSGKGAHRHALSDGRARAPAAPACASGSFAFRVVTAGRWSPH